MRYGRAGNETYAYCHHSSNLGYAFEAFRGYMTLIKNGSKATSLLIHVLALTGIGLVVFSTGCGVSTMMPPPSAENLPSYPGAQELKVLAVYAGGGKSESYWVNGSPQAVLAFYKDTMKKEDWSDNQTQTPDKLKFFWALLGTWRVSIHLDGSCHSNSWGENRGRIRPI
jgi:hypothetical protein